MRSTLRFPFWASIWSLISLSILCGLGTWQLQRLAWKTDIINTIEATYTQSALKNHLTYNDLLSHSTTGDLVFQRGFATGHFMHEYEILMAPRTHEGHPGYHVITPLQMEAGGILLVNRGWVPINGLKELQHPKGLETVTGIVKNPEKTNMFVPENKPDKGSWYRLDIEEIARHFSLKMVVPAILYEEKETLRLNSYPLPQNAKKLPRNNHRQYALFWFSMALVLMVIYYFRFLRATNHK